MRNLRIKENECLDKEWVPNYWSYGVILAGNGWGKNPFSKSMRKGRFTYVFQHGQIGQGTGYSNGRCEKLLLGDGPMM